jgi:hypothetical protein
MAKKPGNLMKRFEKSGFDKDTKKAPEGSKADIKEDKKQFAAFKKSAKK